MSREATLLRYRLCTLGSDLDIGWMAASVVISAVGLGMFLYGKRTSQFMSLFAGILMMVYPYFVPNTIAMIAIGVGVTAFVWFFGRQR